MSSPKKDPIKTAVMPLKMSAKSVAAAIPLRPVRRTFVAPILPDPIFRRFPSPDHLVKITPNGMDPNVYPTSKAVNRYGQENSQLMGYIN